MIILVALFAASSAPLDARAGAGAGNVPTAEGTAAGCVHWVSEAVWAGLAYNHLVHLSSACKQAMQCKVTTNVNPDPVTVSLQPKEQKTVVTYLGSPASEFSAKVSCNKKP